MQGSLEQFYMYKVFFFFSPLVLSSRIGRKCCAERICGESEPGGDNERVARPEPKDGWKARFRIVKSRRGPDDEYVRWRRKYPAKNCIDQSWVAATSRA